MSTETTLFQVVHRLEKSVKHKEIALGSSLDIDGTFFDTSFHTIVEPAIGRVLEETCCRWVRSVLESRLIHTSIMGSTLTANVAGGYPQGVVLSPLLWNFVVGRLLVANLRLC
jgi:hypothetical protein